MVLEVEAGYKLENPTIEELYKELDSLGKKGKTYMYLNADCGSYIQIGGKVKSCVVEVREVISADEFKHWGAKKIDDENETIKQINIGGAKVSVKEKQVLDIDMAKVLFKSFLEEQFLSNSVNWVDITAMFS